MSSSGNAEFEPGVYILDYERAPLRMRVSSRVEKEWRVNAVKKEPWTVAFIEKQPPGTLFVDVGANVGPYTMIAVANGLKVLAIEPSFKSYARLCENLAVNGILDRALVMCCALSDKTDFDWFSYGDILEGSGGHKLGEVDAQLFHRQYIPVMRFDHLLRLTKSTDRIAMKIDVDGFEPLVIAGAEEALKSGQVQAILLELDRKNEALLPVLAGYGFREVGRVDENTPMAEDSSFGKKRFRDMYYVELAR